MSKRYRTTFVKSGLRAANCELRELNQGLQAGLSQTVLSLAADDYDLRQYAKRKAEHCHRNRIGKRPEVAYESLSRYILSAGMVPPIPDDKKVSVAGAVARMCDELWWRRALRKSVARQVEGRAIKLGLVHRHAGLYASDESVTRHRQQKIRNRELLEGVTAVNEHGDEYTLQALADLSVSNPKIRRGELMTRIAGFESHAKAHGHAAEFYTLTCPSKMHARYSASGDPVPNYDETSPKAANEYLCHVWALVRAKLGRLKIGMYGFRVCEPMHDGTPHMHFLLFIDPSHISKVREVFEHYALQEDGSEKGAKDVRFKAVKIDPKKGSAAGYIAKYIAKNIDGFGLKTDLYGHEASSAAGRVSAWASTWGIRQFQQIGGPPVGLWRELRRMGEQPPGIIEDARQVADDGDYAGFLDVMGGPLLNRKDIPIQLATAPCDKLGRYGEPQGDLIIGVQAGNITALSPRHEWEIKKGPALGQPQGQKGPERNCTRDQNGSGTSSAVPEPIRTECPPFSNNSSQNPEAVSELSGTVLKLGLENPNTSRPKDTAYTWERMQREPYPKYFQRTQKEALKK